MARARRLLAALALALAGCGAPAAPAPANPTAPVVGRIIITGSTSLQPLVEALEPAYAEVYPGVILDVSGGGSVVGINAVREGGADIGLSSRELTTAESGGIESYLVAFDALAVIVHPDNPLAGLGADELRGLFSGEIDNWRELGGPDLAVVPMVREISSGSRRTFDDLVMGSARPAPAAEIWVTAGEVAARVAQEPGAVGYVGLGDLGPRVRALPIEGVAPTAEAVGSGAYRLRRPLLLLLGPLSRPLARTFLEFAMGPEGQRLVSEAGWVPAP